MHEINFHYLRYFWTVAREGSILAACKVLLVSQPTVSAQIKALEKALGQQLFHRRGRRLELTEMGHVALRYADEIFTLGRELADTFRGRPTGRKPRFTVGMADVVPKLIAYRLLAPALRMPEAVELTVLEGKSNQLLSELAMHELDLVISDAPVGPSVNVRAFSHLLGESTLTLFGPPEKARAARKRFPKSLRSAPFLLPAESSTLRRLVNQWLATQEIAPEVIGQFEDSALIKAFAQAGAGFFFAPTAIAAEVEDQYRVLRVAELQDLSERYYAISIERRIRHPAVLAISDAAKRGLLGGR